MVNNQPSEPKDITPVNDTLEDLLNNPFSTPTDQLTQTQQNEINSVKESPTGPMSCAWTWFSID